MARILALDWGKKRTGIAVTDPLQLIASPLETAETGELVGWLKKYIAREPVERVLIGYPLNMDGTPTDATPGVDKFIRQYERVFPQIPLEKVDERYSSRWAAQAIAGMGLKRKDRQEKGLLDRTAAAMLLQDYLSARG